MLSLAKILLPVDFSGRCRGAARYAEALANRFDAEILMLHVLPSPQYEFGVLEAGECALRELYAAQSAQAAKDLETHLSA